MLAKVATTASRRGARSMSMKVAVLGAAGGIGQPLSMLCKLSPHIDEVACYDVVGTPGVAADLSHIPTHAKITGALPAAGTCARPRPARRARKLAQPRPSRA